MKKILLPVGIVLAALLVLAGTLIFLLVQLPKLTSQAVAPASAAGEAAERVQSYVAKQRPDYTFVSYDEKNAVLVLAYPLNADYETLKKHGEAAGYGDLAEDHLFSAQLLADGCERSCGVRLKEVVIIGQSSDGKEVYRASTVSGVTACWQEE